MRVFDISERLACHLVGLARSSFRRRLNGGWLINHKKIQRLCGEEGLQVVVKGRQKRTRVSDLPTITASVLTDKLDVLAIEHGSPKPFAVVPGRGT